MQTKAKAIRKYVDKMIQLAKDGSLHARRQVRPFSLLCSSLVHKALFLPEFAMCLESQISIPTEPLDSLPSCVHV